MFESALCLVTLALAPQQGGEPNQQKPAEKAVAAHVGPLRATLERKGRLVPAEFTAVMVELDAYQGPLKILDCAAHGSMVNAGDEIARFDTEKIDEQIEKAEFDLQQAETRMKQSEEQEQLAEAAAEEETKRAESELDWARRKLRGFLEHEEAHDREQDRLSRQATEHNLEDQQDELAQLEKMYDEDELVDATEEIVLKRTRRRLAYSQAWAKLRARMSDYQFEGPKKMTRERLELDTEMKVKAFERTRRSQELTRAGRVLGLERSRFDLQRQRDALAELRRDRERLVVRAPRDGILLHGEEDSAPGSGRLEKGGTATAGKVIMTIADPDRFEVRTDVPESHVLRARTGSAVQIALTAIPDHQLVGALRVDLLPSSREGDLNLYEARIPVAASDPRYRPGMGCKVTVILEEIKKAVLVPVNAVSTEDGEKVVRCGATEAGPFAQRKVVVGPDDGKHVVIREGVAAGEYVVVSGQEKK